MKSLIASMALLAATTAWGQTAEVRIEQAWIRGTVPGQSSTGAFMNLTAPSNVRLVDGHTPVAGAVEIHEMAMDGYVMRMRQISSIDLKAGKKTELKAGGHHLMLTSLKQRLEGGQTVPLTLVFEDGAGTRFEKSVDITVKKLGETGPASSSHSH